MALKKYSLTVVDIVSETKDCVTLKFKQPSLRKIKYSSGQYLTIIVNIKGRKYTRPYSISSEPSSETTIDITVKRVSGGIVSNYINDSIKIGDIFEVMEPMGDFVVNLNDKIKQVYLWGVGSGITPLFSLLKELLISYNDVNVHLVYGSKSIENQIFKDKLEDYSIKYPERFFLISFYSQGQIEKEEINSRRGRITTDFVEEYVLSSYLDKSESLHFICGPNQLKNDIRNALLSLNIHESSILSEDYGLAIEPTDLELVKDCNAIINYQGHSNKVFIPKGKSILDVALDNNIDLPYSCQTGNCCMCKASIISGDIKMIGLAKAKKELVQNETLLCCSFPLTSELKISL